ncbi:glycosyltransferase [Candidatus Gottesmanbacteria bacterium]|nr:glycosyltransferase [Candidatus Gottesmanbacteria bacterium]
MKNQKLTLTVGFTTCYGDESILDTVHSIRNSKGIGKFRFIIVADRNPIKPKVKKELKKLNVELIENKYESGQMPKKKQIIAKCNTDILLLTNDDVLFDSYAIARIMERFKLHPQTTFISIHNKAIAPTHPIEDILTVGTRIANRIAYLWKKGDNYLSVIGRCEAIRTEFLKSWAEIPDDVATTDAYFYFANKKNGGKYEYIPTVSVYFKNPQSIKEFMRKSSRFQYSKKEMSSYFGNLDKEYKIPRLTIFQALLEELFSHPLKTIAYFFIFTISRFAKLNPSRVLNANWEIDLSTKKIYESKN